MNLNDPSGLDYVCDVVASGESGQQVCYETDPGQNGVAIGDDSDDIAGVQVEGTSITVSATQDPVNPYDASTPSGIQISTPTLPTFTVSGTATPAKSENPAVNLTGSCADCAACLIGALPKVLGTAAFGIGLTAVAAKSYANPVPPPENFLIQAQRIFEVGLKWGLPGQFTGAAIFLVTYEVQLNLTARYCSAITGYTPWALQP